MPKRLATFALALALLGCAEFALNTGNDAGFERQAKGSAATRNVAARATSCPDQEASALLNQRQFIDAKQLLQRRLSSASSRSQRYCDLLSLSLAYAMPAAAFHDLAMARQFYGDAVRLARKGTVPQGARLFAQTLQQLLTTQGEVYSLQKNTIELRNELAKKEDAIQRLKDLTLGNSGTR